MKRIVGLLLVSCSFLMAATVSVIASPSSGVHSATSDQDAPLMLMAEFTPAIRVFPKYGQPVTVYAVNISLSEVPKDVNPSANSPPSQEGVEQLT